MRGPTTSRCNASQLRQWSVIIALLGGSGAPADEAEHRLSVTIPLAAHTITETDSGHRVYVEAFGALHEPGVPQLPVRIFPIAIPPGAEVVRVTYTAADPVTLPARYHVPPAPVWEPISHEDEQVRAAEQQRFDSNHTAIYGTDERYPATPVEFVRHAGYRGYNLVDVRVTPLAYRPVSGRLLRYTDITVHAHYRLPEQRSTLIAESSPAIERSARDLILNYEQAAAWHTGQCFRRGEQYEFVVVTLAELVDDVAALVTWEQQKGRSVQVVTTQWVQDNYPGVDLAERIRNFLRDKYPAGAWGIEHVLLVGDHYDVPMRVVWQDLGYGHPFTDTYYAELSLPDTQSWDQDGDGRYAEEEDQIDFYNEICVGRIPWSDPAVVQHICEKSVLSEQNHDPAYKRNILLLGAFFWPDTDCALLMETIAALPHLADWTDIRMYELGYSMYPMDYDITHANVVSEWSSGQYGVVTWCGHGSTTSAHRYYPNMPAFITSADCAVLNDSYPSIVFADSCYTSYPLEASLGLAAMNSLIKPDGQPGNAFERVVRNGAGKIVTVVGRFPSNERIAQVARRVYFLEMDPREGELPPNACEEVIPESDVVVITATALINKTLPRLLELSRDAMAVVLGPSTPMNNVLFHYGADILAGVRVTDTDELISSVTQGVKEFRKLAGIEAVMRSRPDH